MKAMTFYKRVLAVALLPVAAAGPLAADYVYQFGPAWIGETNGVGLNLTAFLLMVLLLVLAMMLTYSSFDD